MKVLMRLAMVLAILLLVTNMVFAQEGCDQEYCYEITGNDQGAIKTVNGIMPDDMWRVCLNNDGTGSLYSFYEGTTYDLYLFGTNLDGFDINGSPVGGGNMNWISWVVRGEYGSGFIRLMPSGYGGGSFLTGAGENYGTRYTVSGKKVPLTNCERPE
jgi:hypothetical protein